MSEETAEKAQLYIDTREKKLQPHIKSEYIEKQLDLGDIFIDSPSYKLMIERKTISDFNASLRFFNPSWMITAAVFGGVVPRFSAYITR